MTPEISASVDGFPLFPNLPLEIRRIIWNFALLQSPVLLLENCLEIFWRNEPITTHTNCCQYLSIPKAIVPKQNSLFLSCREAHKEIRRTSYKFGKGRIFGLNRKVKYLIVRILSGHSIQTFQTHSALQIYLECDIEPIVLNWRSLYSPRADGPSQRMDIEIDFDEELQLGVSTTGLDLTLPTPKFFRTIFDHFPTAGKMVIHSPKLDEQNSLLLMRGISDFETNLYIKHPSKIEHTLCLTRMHSAIS